MPVDVNLPKEDMIYQREQYAKGGLGRLYWDYRDESILRHVGDGKTLVEVGCGEGILLEKMTKLFSDKTVFAIEPEPENVEICKSHNLDVRPGSVYELPMEDASVDTLLFIEVIEHLDDPDLAIREISRVIKPGGKLILLFPNDAFFKMARILTFKFKEAHYDAGHVKQWRPGEAKRFVESAGFKVEKTSNIPFFLWTTSLHCLIVATKV